MSIKFPVGSDRFCEIRQNGDYYIDKTLLIKKLLLDSFKVQLITRPRRFGKTLTMSMLEDFFDIRRDSRDDFAGLKISAEKELCDEWMNQWPIVSLSLKSIEGETFESAYGMFKVLVSGLCKKYNFLEMSSCVDEADKSVFKKLKFQEAENENLKDCLYLLTRMLNAHFGKPVILLIDEYDVPLAKANEKGYYDQMLDVIRALFDKALKTNEYLKFAVITGCLKVSKESIFTGVNNFVTDTIADNRFDEFIGFTEGDVQKLLENAGLTSYALQFKEWYDGYRFGSVDVYCPWDVLNYARVLQDDPQAEPGTYWTNSSGNYILRKFLRKAGRTTKKEVEDLIAGGSTVKQVNFELTYNELEKNIANLWSVLYMTGYLTVKEKPSGGKAELVIPNREVHEIYVSQIREWFEEDVIEKENTSYEAFCRAFAGGDAEGAEKYFNAFLVKSISIRDTFVRKPKKENFYHGILLGMFMSRSDWYVHSNSEDGDGYSDIHVEIDDEDTAFVVEVKYAEKGDFEDGCDQAMEQISRMNYIDGLKNLGFGTIYAYGIACYKKRCKVICKKM